MTVEAGHLALVLALLVAVLQGALPLLGARLNDARLLATAPPASVAQFVLVAFAFAALVNAYVASDFSVANVWSNSHSQQPLIYRFTSTWGNHEGSMLLWILILALFGASVAAFGRHLPLRLKSLTLAVQAWIAAAFLLFVLLTSNPFARLNPAPGEGQDLNPILQDLGLAIHPPLLYVGYVGFSITFAFAVAALIEGRLDSAWGRWVRPWALGAWAFLTLGIAMGSYWAYYELGWGGWWFWDPVENASLMPWLAGTALLHSAIVVEKRGALRIWTVLLALVTFALSLLGTFLVRSGVLTSVHTFASDPSRGVAILAILVLFVGGSFALFAWRAPSLRSGGLFAPVSRESALVLNNFFLTAAAATVLIGTLYPLGYEAIAGDRISVGPPFFNLAVVPIFAVTALAVPFGPFLPWKRGDLAGVLQRLGAAMGAAALVGLVVHVAIDDNATLAPLGVTLGVFLVVGTAAEMLWRARLGRAPVAEVVRRLGNLPRSAWGGAVSHAGVGVMIVGIAATAWATETIVTARPGETFDAGGFAITYDGVGAVRGPNWVADEARFTARRDGEVVARPISAKRLYEARQAPTTEAGIETLGVSQLYVSLGDVRSDGTAVIRVYWKPWITLIWGGALLMAFGGALSLFDRRLRIGVANKPATVPAAWQPAE